MQSSLRPYLLNPIKGLGALQVAWVLGYCIRPQNCSEGL